MNAVRDGIGQSELRYFGRVTASISHELKNVLAILNEQAGLLRDYVAMTEQGRPLDPERIGRMSTTMAGQIARGDTIIKRMNRFAHSVDQDVAAVALDELVVLVAELFARTASTRGVAVEMRDADKDVRITTRPFALETLLGSLLDRFTGVAPEVKTIGIAVRAEPERRLTLAGFADHSERLVEMLAEEECQALLAVLDASAVFDPKRGELFITLPDSIQS